MTNPTSPMLEEGPLDHVCELAWLDVHWHPGMPSFAHERLWNEDWGINEQFREVFVATVTATLQALKHPDEGAVEAMALRLMQRKSFETPEQVSAAIFTSAIEHIQKGEG